MRRRLTLSNIRSVLYQAARALGDVQAVAHGHVGARLGRRAAGRLTGRFLGWLFRRRP